GFSIMLANIDGSAQQTLATFPLTSRIWGLAWSPDGQHIAYAMRDYRDANGQDAGANLFYLAERPVNGGPERMIVPRQRKRISGCVWLPDGSGLVAQLANETLTMTQLYHISYPDGALRQLTNDVNGYSTPVLTADGKQLLSGQGSAQTTLRLAQL